MRDLYVLKKFISYDTQCPTITSQMPKAFLNYFIALLLLLPDNFYGQSQQFMHFSKENGLCHNLISKLHVDKREVLWIGTLGNGLCSYDGRVFSSISRSSGLKGSFVEDIVTDAFENLWILTEEGPTSFNGYSWKYLPVTKNRQLNYQALAASNAHHLVMLADSLYQYNYTSENWEVVSVKDEVVNVFGVTTGIYLISEGTISRLGVSPAVESWLFPDYIKGSNIADVIEIADVTYIGLVDGGIITFKDGTFQTVSNSEQYSITGMDASGIGGIWVATAHSGLLNFNTIDSLFLQIGGSNDLPFMDLSCVEESLQGQTWVSSKSQGIAIYQGPKYHTIQNNSSDPKTIRRIITGGDSGPIVLQVAGDIWQPNHSESRFLNLDSLTDGHDVVDIHMASGKDEIYLTDHGRLILKQSDHYKQFYQFEESHNQWKSITRDLSGQIWAASSSGLYKVGFSQQAGQIPIIAETIIPGTENLDIKQVLIDAKIRKWILTEDGIGFIENDMYSAESLPVTLRNLSVMALDQSGRLWLGTEYAGIYFKDIYKRDALWKKLNATIAIQWPGIRSMLVSDRKIVISSENEIQVFDYDYLTGLVTSWKKLGEEQGVTRLNFLSGSLVGDVDGIIWAGAKEGVLQIRMGSLPEKEIPGSVYFEKVLLGYEDLYETQYKSDLASWYNQNRPLSFAPNENQISFSYRSVIQPGTSPYYQYRLIGAGSDWTDVTSGQEVQFASLTAGEYQFEVRAVNYNGSLQGKSAFFNFEIRPHFWAQPWFILLAALVAILLLGFIYKSRVASIRKKAEERESKLEMEKAAMDLERKALQLQMNPHFIFNAINSIQSQIQKQDLSAARTSLTKFAKLMRLVLESSREATIPLDEEIELLENYVRIASLSQGTEIDFNIQLDKRLESEEVLIPPMMLQPFIENAIEHGFAGLPSGTIDLEIELKGRNLIVLIKDDGRGLKSARSESHKSLALQVIAERLSLMKRPGNFKIQRRDQRGIEKGTIVSLVIPLDQE